MEGGFFVTSLKKMIFYALYIALGFGCFAVEIILNPWNPLISGCVMIFCAIAFYFYIVCVIADYNWLDVRAVFSAFWMGTVGLAALRLTGYQEEWQPMTWVLLGLAFVVFQIGAGVGDFFGKKTYLSLQAKVRNIRFGRVHFLFSESRLFPLCVIVTLIGLTCFVINIAIKGFIPCFSDSTTAYMDFYTKFHVFAVASTAISGLCYYSLRTQPLRIWQKIVLYVCIFYTVFIFPIMVVSRGVFVVAAISLTVSVFYLHKKKLISLILCFSIILGVYWGCSSLRNYTDDQLSVLFDPIKVELPDKIQDGMDSNSSTSPGATIDTSTNTDTTVDISTNTDTMNKDFTSDRIDGSSGFQLSPKAAFLYGYLTVSHDNFNEAVQNVKTFAFGVRQLAPFNVILRSEWISQKASQSETFLVRPHLNTTNLIGDFYYDFGIFGIVFCTLFWAFLFGLNQGMYEKGKGPFALLLLGNTMVPIAMSFFSTWLSLFNHWLLWGTVVLIAISCCLQSGFKRKNSQ